MIRKAKQPRKAISLLAGWPWNSSRIHWTDASPYKHGVEYSVNQWAWERARTAKTDRSLGTWSLDIYVHFFKPIKNSNITGSMIVPDSRSTCQWKSLRSISVQESFRSCHDGHFFVEVGVCKSSIFGIFQFVDALQLSQLQAATCKEIGRKDKERTNDNHMSQEMVQSHFLWDKAGERGIEDEKESEIGSKLSMNFEAYCLKNIL